MKIDRSFIANIQADETCLRVVRAILGLCREMNLAAIAEGVESPEQAQALRELGCEFAQGYLFARALPEDAALRWIAEQTRPRPVADSAA